MIRDFLFRVVSPMRQIARAAIRQRRRFSSSAAAHATAHPPARRSPPPQFDPAWYLSRNPDVRAAGIDPFTHYLTHGTAEGRVPHPLFDPAWYVSRNPDVRAAGMNPFVHFLDRGAAEGRSPHPLFDTAWYLDRNPDARAAVIDPFTHYLTHGTAEGRVPHPLFDPAWYVSRNPDVRAAGGDPFAHFLTYGAAEGRDPHPLFDAGWYLANTPGAAASGLHPLLHFVTVGAAAGAVPSVGAVVRRLARGERPTADGAVVTAGSARYLVAPAPSTRAAAAGVAALAGLEPDLLPFNSLAVATRLPRYLPTGTAVHRATDELLRQMALAPDRVILLPWLKRGGAEQIAINLLKLCLAEHGPGSVSLLVTDHDAGGRPCWSWLPPGAVVVNLPGQFPELSAEDRVRVLANVLAARPPAAVMNVNSQAGWEVYKRYGKPLAQITRLYAKFFCFDYTPDGLPVGYAASYLRPTLAWLTRVYIDNAAFADRLADMYALSAAARAKLCPAYTPIDLARPRPAPVSPAAKRPAVLWAGRVCRQKRPDLVDRVAALLPQTRFDVHGATDPGLADADKLFDRRNVRYHGPYTSFPGLVADHHRAFLYTSAWDGLPVVLLEALAAGLPVVAPDVGGIRELVGPDTGWLVADPDNPDAYATALRELLADPDEAHRRMENGRRVLADRHSWAAYADRMRVAPSFL